MSKPWITANTSAIPEKIRVKGNNNLVDMLLAASETHASLTAFSHFDSRLSYRDIESLSRDFSAYLQNIGIKKGHRVALMLPNHLAFPVACFGILRAGAVQVNMNPRCTAQQLKQLVNDAGVKTIVIFTGSSSTLADIIDQTPIKTVIVVDLDDLVDKQMPAPACDSRLTYAVHFLDALKAGKGMHHSAIEIAPDDLAFLQYASKDALSVKGVMLSHRNVVSNILQYEAFFRRQIDQGREVIISAVPLYQQFSLTVNLFAYYRFGATNILITNPSDLAGFVDEWFQWKITAFTGLTALYHDLLSTPGFEDIYFSSLRTSIVDAPVLPVLFQQWQEITGVKLTGSYRLSEISPVLTLNPESAEVRGCIGFPLLSTEVSLRDESGHVVSQGSAGELCVRGPQVMVGYWQQPKATAEVMTADGYYRTGDLAEMDSDGKIRLIVRGKNRLRVYCPW